MLTVSQTAARREPLRTVPKGVMQAPVTPFTPDNRVDLDTFERLINFHVEQGTSSVCVVLHIAESLNLTIPEHKALIEASVRAAGGRVPVIANVSRPGTDEAIDLARHAERVGADGIISISPYYWPCPEEALFEHFVAVATATDLPFMAYNSPLFQAGVSLTPRLLVRLIERLPNFIGEKEASHNFEYFIEARRATQAVRPDFSLILGVEYLVPSIIMGGGGSMSVSGAVAPRLINRLYQACIDGRWDEARALQDQASHLWQLFKVEYPAPIKAAMEMMGRPVGQTRLPIRPLDEAGKRRLRAELEGMGIFETEPHGW